MVVHEHIGTVITENVSLFIPATGYVIPSTRVFYANRSYHVVIIAKQQFIVNSRGLMLTDLVKSALIMGITCGVKIPFNTSFYCKRVFEYSRASQERGETGVIDTSFGGFISRFDGFLGRWWTISPPFTGVSSPNPSGRTRAVVLPSSRTSSN